MYIGLESQKRDPFLNQKFGEASLTSSTPEIPQSSLIHLQLPRHPESEQSSDPGVPPALMWAVPSLTAVCRAARTGERIARRIMKSNTQRKIDSDTPSPPFAKRRIESGTECPCSLTFHIRSTAPLV